MSRLRTGSSFQPLFVFVMLIFPLATLAQPSSDIKDLQTKLEKLSEVITQLKTDLSHSNYTGAGLECSGSAFTKQDSLRIVAFRRKQSASRAQIDALTFEIIQISKQLENPQKRLALAKYLHQLPKTQAASSRAEDDTLTIADPLSARSIDLAAVKLVRKGKSLDQARLLTIDKLSPAQVRKFYRSLPKNDRYGLYDIANEIAETDSLDLVTAQRSALYFYLFTK